jgi:hypothetical protein
VLAGPKQFVFLTYATFLPEKPVYQCQMCMRKGVTTQAVWAQNTLGFGKALAQTHAIFPIQQAMLDIMDTTQDNASHVTASQWNIATMQYELPLLYWPGKIHVGKEVEQFGI